jgi:hypothetical protein
MLSNVQPLCSALMTINRIKQIVSTKTATESPVRKGGGEWRVVFVGAQGACPRDF